MTSKAIEIPQYLKNQWIKTSVNAYGKTTHFNNIPINFVVRN